MLEHLRRCLRSLVKLIEPKERKNVYSDFEDEIGPGVHIDLPEVGYATDRTRFQAKVLQFLNQHQDHLTIRKLRGNLQLTAQDLSELERIFQEAGIASPEDLERIREEGGLGLFIRSLVGLDREAAKKALGAFLEGRTFTSNQIEFVNLVIDHLTACGTMDPARLYESPFTDFSEQGVAGVFSIDEAKVLLDVLKDIQSRAAA
jgi:type I restriction enzyme R subunit